MLVEQSRLIELLEHKDPRVSDAASEALRKFFPGASGVIPFLMKRVENPAKGDDAAMAAAMMGYFTPTTQELTEILKLIVSLEKKRDNHSAQVREQLKSSILAFPFPLLQACAEAFAAHPVLSALYTVAENVYKMKTLTAEEAWASFERYCQTEQKRRHESHQEEADPQGEEILAGEFLLMTLEAHGTEIQQKILQALLKENEDNLVYLDYLVRLAGSLHLAEAVPALFRILKKADTDSYCFAYCVDSLGLIGTPAVVAMAFEHYRENNEFGMIVADILSLIPQDYAEETLAKLLNDAADVEVKTAAAGALCEIFSNKYRESILNMIRKQKYDPFIVALLDCLVPVYAYYDDTIPNFTELEKKDIAFCNRASRPTLNWEHMEHDHGCTCMGDCDCDANCEDDGDADCEDDCHDDMDDDADAAADCNCGHHHSLSRSSTPQSSSKKKKKKKKNRKKRADAS